MEPSPTPTADAVQAWLKAQQPPPAATGETVKLRRPRAIPVRRTPRAALSFDSLLALFVLCFVGGMLVRDSPALIIGTLGLVVAVAWKVGRR